MECPDCGYAMTPFEKECLRCKNARSRNEHRVNPYVAHQERLAHEAQAAKSFQPPADVTDSVEPQTGWQVGLPPPADVRHRAGPDYVETDSSAPDAHGPWAASGSPRVAPMPPLTPGVPDTAQPVYRSPSSRAPVWVIVLLVLGILICLNGFGLMIQSHANLDRVDDNILATQAGGNYVSDDEAATARSVAMTEDEGTQQQAVIAFIIGGPMCLPFFVLRKQRADRSKG